VSALPLAPCYLATGTKVLVYWYKSTCLMVQQHLFVLRVAFYVQAGVVIVYDMQNIYVNRYD
jgi:hypothetical protein